MSLLTDLFDAQLAVLKSDVAKTLIPQIQAANNNIASNPTILNLVAQADGIAADAIAAGPGILQDEAKALAQWVNTQLQDLANPPPAPAPAPATAAAK
jgi:hypothetical protein